MVKFVILGITFSYLNLLILTTFFSCFFGCCFSSYGEVNQYNSFTYSSFSYPESKLNPYDWRYIRVDLPPWFSSMSISLESDVDHDEASPGDALKTTMPIICLRDGSPPLPDTSMSTLKGLVLYSLTNQTFGGMQNLQNLERCYPMQKNISMQLTNEQISPGAWYFGLFNGLGPTRLQSKMINRGSSYSFSASISVRGCAISTMSGKYCNQTVSFLSCDQYNQNSKGSLSYPNSFVQSAQNVLYCKSSLQEYCHGDGQPKVYALDIVGVGEHLTIMVTNVRFNDTISSNNKANVSQISLTCYARHDAFPISTSHDYSGDLNKAPLFIPSPKVGRWYITILPSNISNQHGEFNNSSTKACYSMEWNVLQCPAGKAGFNCSSEKYTLQTVLRRSSLGFESYYLPDGWKASPDSANFPLQPLFNNTSFGQEVERAWTYFLLDIPSGATGGNIHIRLSSKAYINYEVYARYGALPQLDTWDYFYANMTHNSNGSTYFKLYDYTEGVHSFYILYPKEGTWGFGVRKAKVTDESSSIDQSTMSISLESCPEKCSSHGVCHSSLDASGLTLYSYCWCDRDHGGFDCSVEIVTHKGHIWQTISLIASNAAAVLPAFWALRQKAFAEWVLFTCSGISSGLYHSCDVGTWCALNYNVLQFMDFWLSFMAVVSTFIYLASIDEGSKRTIHTVVFILTALMAATNATRSSNIALVISIGAVGLLIGWMIEFSTNYRSFSIGFSLRINNRWQTIKGWLGNLVNVIRKRFRWGFLLAGIIAFALAATSWKMETSESYWIWHSLWHVCIYTSSFLFLCSKVNAENSENQAAPDGRTYELTRQDSSSRGG